MQRCSSDAPTEEETTLLQKSCQEVTLTKRSCHMQDCHTYQCHCLFYLSDNLQQGTGLPIPTISQVA